MSATEIGIINYVDVPDLRGANFTFTLATCQINTNVGRWLILAYKPIHTLELLGSFEYFEFSEFSLDATSCFFL